MSDSESLKQCVRNALSELQGKRQQFGEQTQYLDSKLEKVKAKKERLGLTFADGAVGKELYIKKLQELNKAEGDVLKARNNLDPEVQAGIAEMESCITSIEKMLNKDSGRVLITEFGIWGLIEDLMAPLGYNAWLETDGMAEIGSPREQDTIKIESSELAMKGILPPEGFWLGDNPRETITRNMRAILGRFAVRIFVFRVRIEIRGAIPKQVIEVVVKAGMKLKGGQIIHLA